MARWSLEVRHNKKGTVYYRRQYISVKQDDGSLKQTNRRYRIEANTKRDAQALIDRLNARNEESGLGLQSAPLRIKLSKIIPKFTEHMEALARHPRYISTCKNTLEHAKSFWGENALLSDINSASVRKYQQYRLQQPAYAASPKISGRGKRKSTDRRVSPNTVNHETTVLRRLTNFAIEQGYLGEYCRWRVQKLSVQDTEIVYLTVKQRDRFLKACRKVGLDVTAYSALALYAAYRNSSIVELVGGNFDPTANRIRRRVKGDKWHTVPIHSELKRILEEYLGTSLEKFARQRNRYLFPSPTGDGHISDMQKNFKLAAKKAKMPWITSTILRHTFGSLLAQRGIPLQQIAELMGHTSMEITRKHYAALAPGNLDEAILKLDSNPKEG